MESRRRTPAALSVYSLFAKKCYNRTMIYTNNLSPIFFESGPLRIHWYGLSYVVGIAFAYLAVFLLFKKRKFPTEHLDSAVIYLFFGMIIGARLGHVFFYESAYYLRNPVDILKIWEGGLASHGAAVGVLLAYLLWIKVRKVKFPKYADTLILGFPLLAGFVRVGNFFNSEILGNPTNAEWGVIFARLGEDFPRHPVQLYSALMNWLIFVILLLVYRKYYDKTPPLFFLFLYMMLYFSGRFIVEFWKDLHGPLQNIPLSMGQLLSVIPIFIALTYFGVLLKRKLARG